MGARLDALIGRLRGELGPVLGNVLERLRELGGSARSAADLRAKAAAETDRAADLLLLVTSPAAVPGVTAAIRAGSAPGATPAARSLAAELLAALAVARLREEEDLALVDDRGDARPAPVGPAPAAPRWPAPADDCPGTCGIRRR